MAIVPPVLDWREVNDDRSIGGVYSFMMYAYPGDFRRQYGAAMRQVFRDRCRDDA